MLNRNKYYAKSNFKIDCEKKIGSENERLDNEADITTLNSLGWKPKINLYDYIKENRNVN